MREDLSKEAKEYAENEIQDRGDANLKLVCEIDFMAGAQSKDVQGRIIEAQIKENQSMLPMLELHGTEASSIRVRLRIQDLQKKLELI